MKSCFLCDVVGGVKDFTEKDFRECFVSIIFRKKNNFKHGDIKFDVETARVFGYHRKCLIKITLLKARYRDAYDDFFMSQNIPAFTPFACSSPKAQEKLGGQQLEDAAEEDAASTEAQSSTSASMRSSSQNLEAASISGIANEDATSPADGPPCIFCSNVTKRMGAKRFYVVSSPEKSSIETIFVAARELGDTHLLTKLENSNKITYHGACLSAYQVNMKRHRTNWHQKAITSLLAFIEVEVMAKNKVFHLAQLSARYNGLLLEFSEEDAALATYECYRVDDFQRKIMSEFGGRICVETHTGPSRKKIVYAADIDADLLARGKAHLATSTIENLEDVAYELRRCAWKQGKTSLKIPEQFHSFMTNLIDGPEMDRENPDGKSVRIMELCENLISAINEGHERRRRSQPQPVQAASNADDSPSVGPAIGRLIGDEVVVEDPGSLPSTSRDPDSHQCISQSSSTEPSDVLAAASSSEAIVCLSVSPENLPAETSGQTDLSSHHSNSCAEESGSADGRPETDAPRLRRSSRLQMQTIGKAGSSGDLNKSCVSRSDKTKPATKRVTFKESQQKFCLSVIHEGNETSDLRDDLPPATTAGGTEQVDQGTKPIIQKRKKRRLYDPSSSNL